MLGCCPVLPPEGTPPLRGGFGYGTGRGNHESPRHRERAPRRLAKNPSPMNASGSSNSLKRQGDRAEQGGPAKRSNSGPPPPSISNLQRELQIEIERRSRCEESVEQLRLELQLMGRLLASAREQLIACGAPGAQQHGVALRMPPAGGGHRSGRSKSDSKLIQRLQDELAESKAQCRRLALQAEAQQHKAQQATASKQQLLALVSEMHEYLGANRA